MKIVSISWVRNEADVIEAFVRHSCTFADRMIIVDNRSADNTGDILRQLKSEGLPIDIRHDDSFVHRQGEAMTALLHELRSDAPDFVIPLDADEFLRTDANQTVRQAIEQLPQDIVTLVLWRTYIPMPEDAADELNVPRRIRHRKTSESPQWYKVIIPGTFLQQNILLPLGSHCLMHAETNEELEHEASQNLVLAHFPVRSSRQIAGKVFGGWLSHLADPNKMPGTIFQWKTIFDDLKSGQEISRQKLMQLAMDYGRQESQEPTHGTTLDPVPAPYEIHCESQCLPPLQVLAESAEYLAEEYAKQLQKNRVVEKRNSHLP